MPVPPWLVPAIVSIAGGVLGYKGQQETNAANIALTKEQMDFQERMSNTAAQRAVKDYEAAGLNPALAYDRSASSPGGASTTIGNATAAGLSSAMAVAAQRQQMELTRKETESRLQTDAATRATLYNQSEKANREIKEIEQRIRFNEINQPADLRTRNAEARLRELLIPGAKNTADFEEWIGKYGKGVGTAGAAARAAAEIAKIIGGRR